MANKVFVLDSHNQLSELSKSGFESEDVFQRILADHPTLLDCASDGEPPLLIRREQPVSDREDGSGRWSLDHLYVDSSGVPILVEVKRATDTRARREVVAQMLDYAANGVAFWPLADLIEAFEQTCRARGEAPEQALGAFLGPDTVPDAFWQSVEANLRGSRIRMVFVADVIPGELRRIVEFLNEQMRPAEVLAVEVELFKDDNIRTLVPRLIGATERAQATKAVSGSGRKLSLDEWLGELAANHGEEASAAASRALDWFRSRGCRVAPAKSGDAISVSVSCEDGKTAWPFFIRSNAALETCLLYLRYRPFYSSDEAR